MASITDPLDLGSETETERLARLLADSDADLLEKLIRMREVAGLSQTQLAEKLGVTQATISSFERYDNDPKLSTLRRYALGVGALVTHVVETNASDLAGVEGWAAQGVLQFTTRKAYAAPRTGWRSAS